MNMKRFLLRTPKGVVMTVVGLLATISKHVLAGGAWIVERLNKFPLVLTFTGVYFGLFTLVGLVDPLRVAEMFRPPFAQSALFLALFMLTDPPTSPSREGDQVWIGALVAVVSCFAYLAGIGLACRRLWPALFTPARRRPMIESR
jgi:Na+-translocating ferredoxin:NAD+ oxidoreductase RnfD subunit